MPETHLINVDFPAPLSPSSAVTSPAGTSRSQSWRACTGPKFFDIPRTLNRLVATDESTPEPAFPTCPLPEVAGSVDSGVDSINSYLVNTNCRAVLCVRWLG
jgi:hypothetical protein